MGWGNDGPSWRAELKRAHAATDAFRRERDAARAEVTRLRQALALCDECRGNVVAVLCADCYERAGLAADEDVVLLLPGPGPVTATPKEAGDE